MHRLATFGRLLPVSEVRNQPKAARLTLCSNDGDFVQDLAGQYYSKIGSGLWLGATNAILDGF